MTFDYDLFVIGGGSGGVRAGRVAAESGAKVALAEEYRMGGTCVIRGCVPKKLMVFASGYSERMKEAKAYGWDVAKGAFDWSKFWPVLREELDRLEGIYRTNLGRPGTEIFDQRATIVDPHTVKLADGTLKTTKHILVATGGKPFVPDFEGSEHVVTSNEMFHLDALPRRILIVGGGYIACEFAGIMNGMGAETTQFYRSEQILRGFDHDIRDHIANEMRKSGIDLHVGTDVAKISKDNNGLHVTDTHGAMRSFDVVMYATGRYPNSAGLGLEELGVRIGRKGTVEVDDYSQTSVPSIFAVGDVTDRVALTPVAIREGMAFVETVFRGNPTKPDHVLIPTAIFTQPEAGTVGMTEEEARKDHDVEIYRTRFKAMMHAFADREERMMMKLIVDRKSRRVLGCHIVGHHSGEMIQLAGVAVKMGATKEDFDATVAVHPTAAEELVTMREPVPS